MNYRDEKIISRIKEVMKERVLTQKRLENDTGIAQPSISQMFGLKRSALPLIMAMSKVYGINREWLLTGLGEMYGLGSANKSNRHGELLDVERIQLLKELNAIQFRHQDLMNESSKIMALIVKVIEKSLYLSATRLKGSQF